MRKILLLIAVAIAIYIVYENFIAMKSKELTEKVEDKVFEERYDQSKYAKQSEAKILAQEIRRKQEEYMVGTGEYISDARMLKPVIQTKGRYDIRVKYADNNTYVVVIEGNIDNDLTLDVWEVTPNEIRHIIDDITE